MKYFVYINPENNKIIGWLTDETDGKRIPAEYVDLGSVEEKEVLINSLDPETQEVVEKVVVETKVIYTPT